MKFRIFDISAMHDGSVIKNSHIILHVAVSEHDDKEIAYEIGIHPTQFYNQTTGEFDLEELKSFVTTRVLNSINERNHKRIEAEALSKFKDKFLSRSFDTDWTI